MPTVEELQSQIRTLQAELTVVRFERDQLYEQREAVRVYFGGTRVSDVMDRYDNDGDSNSPRPMTYNEIAEILMDMFVDRKIQAIKEMRMLTNLGLKEAKDAIDAASNRNPSQRHWVGPAMDLRDLTDHVNKFGAVA